VPSLEEMHMSRYVLVLLVAVVVGQTCVAQAAEPTLDSLKQTYEAEILKIQTAHDAKQSKLLDTYGRSLDRAVEILKKKGDPDAVLQALTEKKRFDNERTVPGEPNVKQPKLMQDVQASYLKAVGKVEAEKASAIDDLTPNYIAALDRLMKTLTAQEKLDLALNVKEEKQRVEFIFTNIEAKTPKLQGSPSPAKPSAPSPSLAREAGEELALDLGNRVKIEFVWIPPGSFKMGSPDGERGLRDCEGPAHDVTLTKGLWMGKYEVTQEQYQQMTGRSPSKFKDDENPVEQVSWRDATRFCEVLTTKLGRTLPLRWRGKLKTVRLPTEAEWEYACRAGTTTRFHTGDSETDLSNAGWDKGNSGGRTHPVGGKKPNAWGLYDMHGNVWEWCLDWFGADYYRHSPVTDPQGAASGSRRVKRGGSWYVHASMCGVAYRYYSTPGSSNNNIGFRVVLPARQ
jgi:formylglycine-generating enzyme required for sulfatase activity